MDARDNINKLIEEKGAQFRDFRLTKIEKRAAEDGKEELIVEGKACSFNDETTLYKSQYYEAHEIVAETAFDDCDMSDVIFNYNHSGRVYARTRNKTLGLEVKEDGLYMTAVLRADDQGHQELYNDILSGNIDKMSFAFTIRESEWKFIESNEPGKPSVDIRTITAIDRLFDVSAVDIPAYDTTSISARSAFEAVREERNAESIRIKNELDLKKKKLLLLLND